MIDVMVGNFSSWLWLEIDDGRVMDVEEAKFLIEDTGWSVAMKRDVWRLIWSRLGDVIIHPEGIYSKRRKKL